MMSTYDAGVRTGRRFALLFIAAMVGTAACVPADGEEPGAAADGSASANVARIINVEVTPVTRSPFADYVRITGEVEALYDVTVSAEEAGVLDRFFVRKGAPVRRGAAIAKIDDAVLRSQVDESQALTRLAEEQYNRQRRLWQDDGVGSEIAYLQAKSAAEAAAARLATLQTRLDRTVVRAPVDGVLEEDYVEIGEMVSPGTPVARVVSVRQVKITGGVPERFALSVDPGDSASIDLDILPGRQFTGRIGFVGSTVDPQNRTIPIEVVLDNPDGVLKPNMVVNVRVERERLDEVIVVSQEVVIRTENGYQVFLATPEEGGLVARSRMVRLGPSFAGRVVIADGLAVDDPLITLGHRLVDEGSRVKIVNRQGAER
ncbi:MAG TPA: efflux RND transporter periplasmic adaptor subunit [Gemmatimonadales bacterium]|jgi:RND family efflux transporter MFP subunit